MATLYRNFLAGVVDDNPLLVGATTLTSSGLASLPAVTGSDIMWLVLDPDADAGAPELVKVTAHTASATTATIARAQQSTTARQHAQNTVWRAVLTQTDVEAFLTTVATADIEDDAVTGAKIADDQIDSNHYVAGSIDLEHLAADSVDGSKIADDSIDSEHYVDGSIDTAHLADDAVTQAKIADDSVRAAHLTPTIFTATGDTINNGGENITWGAEVQDQDGWGTVGSATLTCPATGAYVIAVEIDWTSSASSQTAAIRVNGTSMGDTDWFDFTNDITRLGAVIHMRAGDTLTVLAQNSSGGAETVNAQISILRFA